MIRRYPLRSSSPAPNAALKTETWDYSAPRHCLAPSHTRQRVRDRVSRLLGVVTKTAQANNIRSSSLTPDSASNLSQSPVFHALSEALEDEGKLTRPR